MTDAARADLKKELTKKGVRKAIVDDVLAKLMHKSSTSTLPDLDGSEAGDPPAKKEYLPPSLALAKRSVSGPAGASIPRTFSQSSIKDIPRPASRAAAATPPPQTPVASEVSDISPVYVCDCPWGLLFWFTFHRLHRAVIWKMNLQVCRNPSRGKKLNITGYNERTLSSGFEGC